MRLLRMRGWPAEDDHAFELVQGNQRVAYVTLKNDLGPTVGYITVDPTRRREGLATKLYEAAAREACRWLKTPLYSDVERSVAAQRFWEKQVRKGRASCERSTPKPRGRFNPHSSIIGRGGCWRYKLTCPAPASLARPQGRR